jgi:hypothetical protein
MARRSTQPTKPHHNCALQAPLPGDDAEEPSRSLLSIRIRWLVSAAIVWHLTAILIGAWIASPPESPFAAFAARPFRPYIAVADLNHGYRFFAPNPGPSHLFRYQLTFDDGSTRDGYFPNREQHWPRLLYHRYFMLSENLNVLRPDLPRPKEAPVSDRAPLQGFRALADSYAAQLLRSTGASRVDWQLVRHYQPPPGDVLAGRPLTHGDNYEPLERGSLTREDLP